MGAEDVIVGAFLAFLLIGGTLLTLSVHRGRVLCREFAQRFPAEYEELGLPLPGFFNSARRSAYMRFVMRGSFAGIADPQLVARFESLKRSEMRQLVFLLAGFVALGAAVVWFEFLR